MKPAAPMNPVVDTARRTWVDVCPIDEITLNRGVCALVGAQQVAVFRVSPDGSGEDDGVFAISNYDPFSKTFVLSRGIVGSRGEKLKVASPIFKQSFDLRTGACLDDPDVSVPTFTVRVLGGMVQVAQTPVAQNDVAQTQVAQE